MYAGGFATRDVQAGGLGDTRPFSVTICTHKLLIAHSSRGCVTSCPFGPNAVGLQYGLHGLGWSQRLSVISRIKGAEQWAASQKFAACKSESLTALTDSDCKLTALLQFTRDWIKLRFASRKIVAHVQVSPTASASSTSTAPASSSALLDCHDRRDRSRH